MIKVHFSMMFRSDMKLILTHLLSMEMRVVYDPEAEKKRKLKEKKRALIKRKRKVDAKFELFSGRNRFNLNFKQGIFSKINLNALRDFGWRVGFVRRIQASSDKIFPYF